MIIELEFLEQISEDDWPLAQSVAFIEEHKEPWQVLNGLYSDKRIEFKDADGDALPNWKTQQILRNRDLSEIPKIFVGITEPGLTRTYPG